MPRNNPYYDGPVSSHFDGKRFFVPGYIRDKSPLDLLKWSFGEARKKWPESYPGPAQDKPPARVRGDALRVSYVGHATLLIQTQGVNLLIDPVWARRASPFSFAGPKRVNAPGIAREDLPELDAVLVSHNHYDHLDLEMLSWLAVNRPSRVITPLGNDRIMRAHDTAIRAEPHDWDARIEIAPGVAVHLEPSYHWSARGISDRRMALWCAFVVETLAGAIYHIADTGFADGGLFHAARAKHGDFRLAILPIGAYEPRWFMADQHVDPAESLRILEIIGARHAMAHHWGTFQLTSEALEEPPRALAAALRQGGHEADRFRVFRPGEVFDVPA